MIGELDGDRFAAGATRRHTTVQHLDRSLGFSPQVESHEANALRQTYVDKTYSAGHSDDECSP